jgi:hypothetical protein
VSVRGDNQLDANKMLMELESMRNELQAENAD